MGAIQSFLTDKLQAKYAEQLIDDTMFRVKQRSRLLDKFMPIKTFDNAKFVGYLTEKLMPIASFITQDGRIPTAAHGGFQRMVGELQRVGLAHQFDGKTQEEMLELMDQAQYKNAPIMTIPNMTGSGTIRGLNDTFAETIYSKIEGLVFGTTDLLTAMAWDVACTGEVNRTDSRTGVPVVINYRDDAASYTSKHFPTALVATGNTANPKLNKWDDLEYADGIGLLQDWVLDYIDTNGFEPDLITMSRRRFLNLCQQKTTIEKSRQLAGYSGVGAVSANTLSQVLSAYGIPPIQTFDEYYQVPYTNAQSSTATRDRYVDNARFLPENRVVMLKTDMGVQAMGQTIEMKHFQNNINQSRLSQEGSSILVMVNSRSQLPLLDTVESMSVLLPVVMNPKYLAGRVVV